MTERTIIPRRDAPLVEGVPDTCPECRSVQIRSESGEWRCNRPGCFAQSPGWMTRPSEPADRIAAATERAADLGLVEPAPTPTGVEVAAAIRNGVAPRRRGRPRIEYSDATMLGHLVASHRQHGKTPGKTWWANNRPAGAPTSRAICARFGSWDAAIKAAGLEPNNLGNFRPKTQPPTGTASPAAEQAAPPPLAAPADPQAVEAPEATLTEAPPEQGVIEAVLPPDTEKVYGFEVDATDLQTLPQTYAQTPARLVAQVSPTERFAEIHGHGPEAIGVASDWRGQHRHDYVQALLATLQNTEITDDTGVEWFDALADHLERVLGLADAS